jgi:hypothetical protein
MKNYKNINISLVYFNQHNVFKHLNNKQPISIKFSYIIYYYYYYYQIHNN